MQTNSNEIQTLEAELSEMQKKLSSQSHEWATHCERLKIDLESKDVMLVRLQVSFMSPHPMIISSGYPDFLWNSFT